MKITIRGTPKEIAALVEEIQGRRETQNSRKASMPDIGLVLTGGTASELADAGPTAEKLGDPAASGDKIAQYLRRIDRTFADLG